MLIVVKSHECLSLLQRITLSYFLTNGPNMKKSEQQQQSRVVVSEILFYLGRNKNCHSKIWKTIEHVSQNGLDSIK